MKQIFFLTFLCCLFFFSCKEQQEKNGLSEEVMITEESKPTSEETSTATTVDQSKLISQIVDNKVFTTDGKIHPIKGLDDDEMATFFVLRHAEKQSNSDNPALTKEGHERAERLSELLKQVRFKQICSTDYPRTLETVRPTAIAQQIPLTTYTPKSIPVFLTITLQSEPGSTILMVGHSNTVPKTLNVLTGTSDYKDIPHSEYDNLYIVSVKKKGEAEVQAFKF